MSASSAFTEGRALWSSSECSFASLEAPASMSVSASKIRDGSGASVLEDLIAENVSPITVLSTDPLEAVRNSMSTLCLTDSIVFQGVVMNKLMDEIFIASKILTGRYYEIASYRSNEVVCATKLLYFGIQRVLKSCQCFSYFLELSPRDQEMLIKESCTEMLLIRSFYHVDLELDAWIFCSPSTVRNGERERGITTRDSRKRERERILCSCFSVMFLDLKSEPFS